jgi:hypothetical protein
MAGQRLEQALSFAMDGIVTLDRNCIATHCVARPNDRPWMAGLGLEQAISLAMDGIVTLDRNCIATHCVARPLTTGHGWPGWGLEEWRRLAMDGNNQLRGRLSLRRAQQIRSSTQAATPTDPKPRSVQAQ